jgi:hypothetical protein
MKTRVGSHTPRARGAVNCTDWCIKFLSSLGTDYVEGNIWLVEGLKDVWDHARRTEYSWLTLKRPPLHWTESRARVVPTRRWSDRFVLVALTRHERSRGQLARARSFLMQVLTNSLHWIHWLWCSVCPSLILCRLAGRDPMQLGAAMLHADWLDGRTLGYWHLA